MIVNSVPTYNYLVPADGTTHAVIVSGVLTAGLPFTINWASFVQSNFPFRPQSAKMQNMGTAPLVITNESTGETSTCPPGASRIVTFSSTANLIQEITGDGLAFIAFYDFPAVETAPVDSNGNPISGDSVLSPLISDLGSPTAQALTINPSPIRGTFTDGSGTTASAGVSQQIFASNSGRQYLLVQNTSDQPLYINFGTVATSTGGSVLLNPSDIFVMDGSFVTTQNVNILGPSAGLAYTAKEG